MLLAFRNISKGGSHYRAKKRIWEDLILPELLSDNLFVVPEDFFSENDDFVRETKNFAMRKNTVKVKQASKESDNTSNAGTTT
jgi:hypothetical protein